MPDLPDGHCGNACDHIAAWADARGQHAARPVGRSGLLAAGAASATGYALHCPEDDPAFFAVWYMGAMLLAALIAAGLGRRALRW